MPHFASMKGDRLPASLHGGDGASAGTMRAREIPIALSTTYTVAWTDYSRVGNSKAGVFRYALLDVVAGRIVSLGSDD